MVLNHLNKWADDACNVEVFFFIGGARGFFLIMYKIEKKRLSIESTSFRYRPNKKKNTISNNIFNTFVRHFFRVFLTLFQNIFEKKNPGIPLSTNI